MEMICLAEGLVSARRGIAARSKSGTAADDRTDRAKSSTRATRANDDDQADPASMNEVAFDTVCERVRTSVFCPKVRIRDKPFCEMVHKRRAAASRPQIPPYCGAFARWSFASIRRSDSVSTPNLFS